MRISTFQLFVGDLNAHPSEPEVNDLGHPAGLTSIVTGNDSEQRNHGAHRYSNHLRGNIVHGHVNRNVYTPVAHNRSLGRKRIRNRIEMGVRNVPPSGKSVYRI